MNLLPSLKLPSPVTRIKHPLLNEKGIQLFIKRDELIHPIIQGNKWRKLKYNLMAAQKNNQKNNHQQILSFGGAYSNHLHALAYAGKKLNIKTIGIIRGEAPRLLNPCLQDIINWGMQLKFIKRIDYKQKNNSDFLLNLKQEFGDYYLIPEGGNNAKGKQGCAEILNELEDNYDFICCEIGSGTMFSALIQNNKNTHTQFLGFAVMKNSQLNKDIKSTLTESATPANWKINHDYHFGGFAKTSAELNAFIRQFKLDHNIQLEPVYSGKLLWGIFDLIKKNHFKRGTKLLAIHGGGLQGLRGFEENNSASKNQT